MPRIQHPMIHPSVPCVSVCHLQIHTIWPTLGQAIATCIANARVDKDLRVVHINGIESTHLSGRVIMNPTAVGMKDGFLAIKVERPSLDEGPNIGIY